MHRAVVSAALVAVLMGSAQAYVAPVAMRPVAGSRQGVSMKLGGATAALPLRNRAAAPLGSSFTPAVAQKEIHLTSMRQAKQVGAQITTMALEDGQKPIIIGLAADSGCGKSTFMRRVTACFGGECKLNPIGRETNTLISDMTTVICLDDYHLNDRAGRKVTGLTALDPRENNFDLMYEQVKAIKEGKSISKPIYNHVNGTLDENETIEPTPIVIFEGLHPFHDDRVNDLMDFKIYVDITPDVKFNWKVQRDHEERGHSIESIKASIEARKPDFDAYIDPQKMKADCVIMVEPTDLAPEDKKTIKVSMIQCEGVEGFTPTYLWDEGSSIEWTPCGTKLACSAPGVKVFYGPDTWAGKPAQVLGMDGKFDQLDQIAYVEKALQNTGAKYANEVSEKMLAYEGQPGSNDGTGLLQTVCSLKVREIYEALSGKKVEAAAK
jgi:phosphoribulokinase